jgi:ketosteroid isomerase-like protein
MANENVEFVRRRFGAALEGDWTSALDKLDPEVEVHDFDLPDAGVYLGHEGFRAWLESWSDGWESWRMEDVEFRAAGEDGVIALFRVVARGRHTGIELERDDAIVYRLRGGKIARLDYFNDQRAALDAAGLRA